MYKVVYVLLMLQNSGQILLNHRSASASFGKGLYALIGGKCEKGETATQALQREAQEELGITIQPSDMNLVHVVNRQGTENELILMVFQVDSWQGNPENKEVEKSTHIKWFDVDKLPDNMIPAHSQILNCIKQKILYSEHGWNQ